MTSTDDGFGFGALAIPAYGPSLLFGLGEGAMLPVLPLSARDVGASVAIAATMVMLINVGSLIFNVPSSIITDRYGERHAIIGASIVGVLASLLFLVGHEVWIYATGAVLYGISASVFMLARQSYLTEAVPATHRARALSTLGGVMRIGVFVGPFIGAAAMSLWHLAGAYVVSTAALALAGVLGATLKELPHEAESRRKAAGELADVTVRSTLHDYRRVFLTVGMGVLLVSAIRATRQAVIPLWAEHLSLSPTTASLIYGISGGIDMLVFYPAGKVMDVYGRRWVTVPSMLVMAVSMMAIPLTHGAVTLCLVTCVLGFGNGIGAGMVMTLGADFSPERGRAPFLGIWRELSDAGSTIGPGVLAGVTAVLSLGAGVIVSGATGLGAAAVMWRSVPTRGKAPERSDDLTGRSGTPPTGGDVTPPLEEEPLRPVKR
ncbi:MFS transporter [Allobranchiibius sp. GilTou38]|uniref:MFS transporter n=1 Tax=Allobranchiibius sp. GilTou38 TaxID=2815210 RepID=UPI001AA1404E|nr:MFS transporter [Allobranchiibius sp. GilTou38]MBO1768127.1 MFS transporter [Allobranchiibius sp. GilTou38]